MVNVLNELLIAHEKYLPQFADKIAELKAAGVTIKDDVARELTEKGLQDFMTYNIKITVLKSDVDEKLKLDR